MTQIDEASALSLVVLGPSTPHSGRSATPSAATAAVSDALTRCRASQRRFRNTLIFVAADEGLLATAREAMRRAMAWADIAGDERLQKQLTQSQAAAARDSAKTSKEGAVRAVRNAWNHILFPVKTDATEAGKAFELEHLALSAKDKGAIPAGVYEKARADGDVLEKLGPDTLWLKLRPLWAEDRPHIAIGEIADWFASYVYLPKVRDRVVLETSIRDAIGKFDAAFGYAERFDHVRGVYEGLIYAKAAPEILAPGGLLVRADAAKQQLAATPAPTPLAPGTGGTVPSTTTSGPSVTGPAPQPRSKPRRFYGSVEIDMNRPVKAFDTILNSVVMELQRSPGAKIKLTLEIEAEAAVGVQRRGCRRGAR